MGAGVGGLLRARVSMHRNDALKFFNPSASVDIRERPDGGDAALLEVVREALATQLRVDSTALRLGPTEIAAADANKTAEAEAPSGAVAEATAAARLCGGGLRP